MREDLKKWADDLYQKTKSGEYSPKESLNEFFKHSQELVDVFFGSKTDDTISSEEVLQSDVNDCAKIVCRMLRKAAQEHPDMAHFEAKLGADSLLVIIERQENSDKVLMNLECFIPEEQGISKEEYRMLEGIFGEYTAEYTFWQKLKAAVEEQLCEETARRYTIRISE